MQRKWIFVLMALIVFFSFTLTINADVVSEENNWGFSKTGSRTYDGSLSNGTISLSATGTGSIVTNASNVTGTLTNNTGVAQVLTGKIVIDGSVGEYVITLPGDAGTLSGSDAFSYDSPITIENGQSLSIKIQSKKGKNSTVTCTYTPDATPRSNKMITCNTARNGTYTVNQSSDASISFNTGDTLTLLAAPDTGYVCLGFWVDGTTLLPMPSGASLDWAPTDSHSITPIFAQIADTSAPFSVNGYRYYTWETAFTAAGAGGTVVLVDDYDLPTTYEANGMTGAGTYVTGTDGALKYEVKSGQTLLLPYSTDDTSIKSGTGSTNDFKHANVNFQDNPNKEIIIANEAAMDPELSVVYTLTVPSGVTLTVNGTNGNPGRVVVGGTILGSEGTNSTIAEGLCYGPHSNLVVDGNLNLGNYSVLSAVGYVLGGGEIKTINADGTNSTGAEIYQPFVIHDWRGGRAAQFGVTTTLSSALATQSGESQVMPFFQWTTMNIHPKLTMTYGNQMIMYASLYDGDAYTSHATLVGPSGLVQLSEGASLTSYYEDIDWGSYSYGFPGRNNVTISGGASLGSFTMTGKLAMGSIDINTANFTLPICYGYSITLVNGTFNLNNPMALLPGSKIEVTSTATLNVNANRFMVFDGLNQGLYHNVSSTGISSPYAENTRSGSQKVKLYPTTRELQGATVNGIAMSADAEFIVDGTLVIGANANFGGVIQTSGTGTIDATAGTAGTTTGAKVQIGVVGNKSIMLQDASIAGMSLHEMNAQIVSAATGERIDVIRGNIYKGSKRETTQEGYSFKYYANAASVTSVTLIGDAVAGDGETATATHDAHPLNETIRGAWCAHSWQDATCTEPKTCTICGATEGEANGHSFTNGVCSVCGINLFTIEAANVVLGNNLDMAFAFTYNGTDTLSAESGFYVELKRSVANGTTKTVIYEFDSWTTNNGYYVVTYGDLAAKEMCDKIELTVYDAAGNQVSNIWTDSIQDYAIRQIAKYEEQESSDEKELILTVLVDMLNYGAAAQERFDYNTSALANSLLSDIQKGYATTAVTKTAPTYELSDQWKASNLVTTSNIQFLMAFRDIQDGMTATVTFTNHYGVEQSIPIDKFTVSGSFRYLTIEKLVVADTWQPVTVTINGEVVCVDSIAGYLSRYDTHNEIDDAYLKFAQAAWTYFHRNDSNVAS